MVAVVILGVFALGSSINSCFAVSAAQRPVMHPIGFTLAMVDLASVDGFKPLPADLAAKGIMIVMDRATIGVGDPDPMFEEHSREAREAGLAVGAYHVPFPTHTADAQAEEFTRTVKSVCRAGDSILLAVDWEEVCVERDARLKNGMAGKCRIKKAASPKEISDLVSAIKSRANGASVLIYTRPDIIAKNQQAIEAPLAQAPLWVAQYWHKIGGRPVNYLPSADGLAPWQDWDFWQWTEGNSPNLSTLISATFGRGKESITPDLSLYNGLPQNLSEFLAANAWKCRG